MMFTKISLSSHTLSRVPQKKLNPTPPEMMKKKNTHAWMNDMHDNNGSLAYYCYFYLFKLAVFTYFFLFS